VKRTVLIVDDEPDVNLYLTTVLTGAGYRAVTAFNVTEAVAAVNEQAPDLVCLDIMMPRESGFSLYRRLKADDRLRDIPVILISGVAPNGEFNFRQYVSDVSVPPPDGFLEKPIQVDEFLRTVHSLTAPKDGADRGPNG
jgi:CheY-like chemotaxis protein